MLKVSGACNDNVSGAVKADTEKFSNRRYSDVKTVRDQWKLVINQRRHQPALSIDQEEEIIGNVEAEPSITKYLGAKKPLKQNVF